MTSTIIYVLCVCFVLKVTIAEDALLLNKYQNEFFKLEDALWNDINEGRYASKESISDVTLIRQFEKFSDKLVQVKSLEIHKNSDNFEILLYFKGFPCRVFRRY